MGSAADDQNVYVAVSDVRMKAGSPEKPGANKSFMGTYVEFDSKAGGGTFALRLATGEQVWHAPPAECGDRKACSPAQSAAVTHIPGVVFLR